MQRGSPDAAWGPPVNLGPAINSIGSNTGSATFTPDGHRMYFHAVRGQVVWEGRLAIAGQPVSFFYRARRLRSLYQNLEP